MALSQRSSKKSRTEIFPGFLSRKMVILLFFCSLKQVSDDDGESNKVLNEQVHDLTKYVKIVHKNLTQILDMKLLKQRKLLWTGKSTEKKLVKPILAPVLPPVTDTMKVIESNENTITEAPPKRMNLRERLEQNKEWQETKGKGME